MCRLCGWPIDENGTRAEIDDLFGSERELGEVLEEVARLGVRLLMQTAIDARGPEVAMSKSTVKSGVRGGQGRVRQLEGPGPLRRGARVPVLQNGLAAPARPSVIAERFSARAASVARSCRAASARRAASASRSDLA